MGSRGYPTALKTRAPSVPAPYRGGAIRPPLPRVQEAGPRPFLDYPMGDWPYIRRIKRSGVPRVARQAVKYGGAALKLGRLVNRYGDLIRIADQVATELEVSGKKRQMAKLNGWEKCYMWSECDLEPTHQQHNSGGCFGNQPGCFGGQAFGTLYALGTDPGIPPPGQFQVIIWSNLPSATATRVSNVAMFQRGHGTGISEGAPQFLGMAPQTQTIVTTTLETTLDPFILPIGKAATKPLQLGWAQIPRRQKNIDRDPLEQYQRGYGTTLDVRNRKDEVLAKPQPDRMVVEVPVKGPPVSVPPGAVPDHVASQPPRGTQEKKLILGASGKVATVINLVTETKDVVEAVYKALPAKRRPKGKTLTPQAKGLLIIKHFKELDPAIAVKELIKNQAEDKLFGKLGKVTGKANRAGSKFSRLQITLGPGL